jgi:hypothetical protein
VGDITPLVEIPMLGVATRHGTLEPSMVTTLLGDFAGSAAQRRTTSASSGGACSGELGTRASGGDAFSTTGHYTQGDKARTMYDTVDWGRDLSSDGRQQVDSRTSGVTVDTARHRAPSAGPRRTLGKHRFM